MDLLRRYKAGECEQVWADLLALGGAVHEEPLYGEAVSVARETMHRARHNIEMLIPRLRAIGYDFGYAWVEPLARIKEQHTPSSPDTESMRQLLEQEGISWDSSWDDFTATRNDADTMREWAASQPPVFALPSHDILEDIAEIEATIGPMPLSLKAWYEMIGAVNFVGVPPTKWGYHSVLYPPGDTIPFAPQQSSGLNDSEESPITHALAATPADSSLSPPLSDASVMASRRYPHGLDPLYVGYLHDPRDVEAWTIWRHLAEQLQRQQGQGRPIVHLINVAPDEYLKTFASGGGPYTIAVPNREADAIFGHEWHHTTFVNYLRICFQWGGFPGLEFNGSKSVKEDLRLLTEGLLPI